MRKILYICKKKKEAHCFEHNRTVSFWTTLFFFLLPLDVQQGKVGILHSSLILAPRVLCQDPKPHALGWRETRGAASYQPRPLPNQLWRCPAPPRATAARSPLAYKYCSQHQQQGGFFWTREGSFETETEGGKYKHTTGEKAATCASARWRRRTVPHSCNHYHSATINTANNSSTTAWKK